MTTRHQSTDTALAMAATDAAQRRASLTRALDQVARQLNVHTDTLMVWLDLLRSPPARISSAGLPLLGLLRHTCGRLLRPGRDRWGEPAYRCHCPADPLIPAQVAHLHVLAGLGQPVRRVVQRHGLAGLTGALAVIRLDHAGSMVGARWRPPRPRPAHERSTEPAVDRRTTNGAHSR
jgi:hypothetical protein